MKKIILFSESPRRKQILKQYGLQFFAVSPKISERHQQGESPKKYLKRICEEKMNQGIKLLSLKEGSALISADTIVVKDKKILQKPKNKSDAEKMLCSLSGKKHKVYTGLKVALFLGKKIESAYYADEVDVWFKEIQHKELRNYLQTNAWKGKAGAYGIQDLAQSFVARVEGNVQAVVGLSVVSLEKLFYQLDLKLEDYL